MGKPENDRNQDADRPVERRRFLGKLLGVLAGTAFFGGAAKAFAQTGKSTAAGRNDKPLGIANPTIGEIAMFAGNFAPVNWHFCDGSLLAISQYQALYSVLGTMYGGDGSSTFALPDLRGRVPISMGQAPGLSYYPIGERGGAESIALTTSEMPSHSHSLEASSSSGTSATPVGNYPAVNQEGIQQYGSSGGGTMSTGAIADSGGGASHENRQPFLTINFIIALNGLYPTRS